MPSALSQLCHIARQLDKVHSWGPSLRKAAFFIEKHCDCITCLAKIGCPCSVGGGTERFLRRPHAPRVQAFVEHVLPHLLPKAEQPLDPRVAAQLTQVGDDELRDALGALYAAVKKEAPHVG